MKAAKKILYVLCSLSLCFPYEGKIAYGQTVNCNTGNFQNGALCGNVKNLYQTIVYPSPGTPAASAFLHPKSAVVTSGNFQFKLLGCNPDDTIVRCNIAVINTTQQDRSLFVASKQKGGIANRRIPSAPATLIDVTGKSYQAEAVSFANNPGDETGQSYFTVYPNTTPTLSLLFKEVEAPQSITRLDVVVGESTSQGIKDYRKIRYSIASQ